MANGDAAFNAAAASSSSSPAMPQSRSTKPKSRLGRQLSRLKGEEVR